jgi:hypothetical protein
MFENGTTFSWHLSLRKDGGEGILQGSAGEIVIKEPVSKQHEFGRGGLSQECRRPAAEQKHATSGQTVPRGFVGHQLGDFPLQSSSMVRGKRQGIRAYLAHGTIYLLVLGLCVAVFASFRLVTSLSFGMAVVGGLLFAKLWYGTITLKWSPAFRHH